MEEIKIDEYIRLDNGEIGKVIDIKENPKRVVYSEYGEIGLISDIVKHSKIISEVVNVGDYVNGKLIHKIDKGPNYCYLYYGNCKTFVDYQIKTILTKESYMANCYKVGGEDEKI